MTGAVLLKSYHLLTGAEVRVEALNLLTRLCDERSVIDFLDSEVADSFAYASKSRQIKYDRAETVLRDETGQRSVQQACHR